MLTTDRLGGSALCLLAVFVMWESRRLPLGTWHNPGPGYFPVLLAVILFVHSEEHLAASDRGVVMFRRLLRQQIEAVQAGRDPLGVIFDPARATITVEAGNFILEPA